MLQTPLYRLVAFAICFALFVSLMPRGQRTYAQNEPNVLTLENLSAGKIANGFRTVAVYLNDSDQAMGARFRHEATGFTLDYLQIQSVPQSFLWVNSYPTSDKGEPHTQEHLLLGKGNTGRAVASLEDMSLTSSSAYTEQWRTIYHSHTAAGADVFYKLFERQTEALLYPNYTDEEVRREVRNYGVVENPADKSLRLEEKGTVYNEMVSSYDRAGFRLFDRIGRLLYGANHPLALSSGGTPEALRVITPEDIKKFHHDNYHLANMGAILSAPKEMTLTSVLARMDEILTRLQKNNPRRASKNDLPAPASAPAGQIEIVEYPHKNEQQADTLLFAYPPQLKLDQNERIMLEFLLENVAGDATTNFYKMFVDTKTRKIETGAQGVYAYLSADLGHPVLIGLSDVAPSSMTEAKIKEVRQMIMSEFARIAALPDGSVELAEFNRRVGNRVLQTRRDLSKFVNSPPGFGFRGTGSEWLEQINRLNTTDDFKRSVTLKPQLQYVENLLAGNKNFWRDLIGKWKLAQVAPYAAAAKPNPKLIEAAERERAARAEQELARLKIKYNTTDAQEAVRRYRADYDRTTTELSALEKADASSRFLDQPPLTLDDTLDYKQTTLAGDVPLVASTFDGMTSGTIGINLKLDGVADDQLVLLAALPSLMRGAGVIRDGKAISYEEMSEQLRREILNLSVNYSTNFTTGRAELAVRGAGNNLEETKRAVAWMRLIMTAPDWRTENLPRLRDVIDQTLSGLRNRMQDSEESWVDDPANAYRRQDDPLLLSTGSFLTQTHNVQRVRWMLKDAGTGAPREAISRFLNLLADASANNRTRAELKTLLGAIGGDKDAASKISPSLKTQLDAFNGLQAASRELAVEAAKDLDQTLADIPDSSLAADWRYLCEEMRRDLLTAPVETLAAFNRLRQSLLKTGGARFYLIASGETRDKIAGDISSLVGVLESAKLDETPRTSRAKANLIDARLRGREQTARPPVYVGLVDQNMQSGVFLNSAPVASYKDTEREKLLQFLAARLYGGGGAHSMFMKTWGAGLAYSNGLRAAPSTGRLNYYAERTPELPQTLRFVIDELKRAPRNDPAIVEYAVAQAFSESRAASSYEQRGAGVANDLADGLTPEMITRFRRAILDLRRDPKLTEEVYRRMDEVYARVLPGYDAKVKTVSGAIYFVIGNDKQLNAYEGYLKSVAGADARLYRLYTRDFWITATFASTTTGSEAPRSDAAQSEVAQTRDDGQVRGEQQNDEPKISGALGAETNPVRCEMPPGERAYLNRLRCADGKPPTYRRTGSFGLGPYGNIIDGYQVRCEDKEPVMIFMDMYHEDYIERRAVPGFTIINEDDKKVTSR